MAKLSDLNLLDVGHTIQMAGAVYIGNGKVYLAMFPEEAGTIVDSEGHEVTGFLAEDGSKLTAETLNMSQEEWTTFLRQADILETEVDARAADGTIAKAILRKGQRQNDQGVSWRVYKRDCYKCRYCGNDDTALTVDHLVCWEVGGPWTEANLVSCCRKCNKTRGNTPYEEWLQHPFYVRVSAGLSDAIRQANVKLVETLASIPRLVHKRAR